MSRIFVVCFTCKTEGQSARCSEKKSPSQPSQQISRNRPGLARDDHAHEGFEVKDRARAIRAVRELADAAASHPDTERGQGVLSGELQLRAVLFR